MKQFARLLLPLLMVTVMLQSCFRPRTEDDQLLEASSTLQATYALDALDACVSGVWKMDVFAIESKYQDLNVSPSMTVIRRTAEQLRLLVLSTRCNTDRWSL